MVSLKSITIVAIVSGASADKNPPEEVTELMKGSSGHYVCRKGKVDLWSFHSPTEAILSALNIGKQSTGASIGAGVAIGEVAGTKEKTTGEPVDDAISLALSTRPRQVLLTKGTQLSMNHNEVDCGDSFFVEKVDRAPKDKNDSKAKGSKEKGSKVQIEAFEAFIPDKNKAKQAASVNKTGTNKKEAPSGGGPLKSAYSPNTQTGLFQTDSSLLSIIAIMILACVVSYHTGLNQNSSPDYLGKAKKAAKVGASSYALELAISGWETDRGNPLIEAFLTKTAIAESERYIKENRADLAVRLLKRIKKTAPSNILIDDIYFKATAKVMYALVQKNRDNVAEKIASVLLLDLPYLSDEIARTIAMAKVERTANEIEEYSLTKTKRVDFTKINIWNETLNKIYEKYPKNGKILFLFARINLLSNRVTYYAENLAKALTYDPSLAQERIILADIENACKKTSHKAEENLVRCVLILSESLDDWVVPAITPWLTRRHSVIRTTAYKALKARNALPKDKETLYKYHLLNLQYAGSTTEKKIQIPATLMIRSLEYAKSLKDEAKVKSIVKSLEKLPEEALKVEEIETMKLEVLTILKGGR